MDSWNRVQDSLTSGVIVKAYNVLNQEVDYDLKKMVLLNFNIASGLVVRCANDFYDDASLHCAIASVDHFIGFIMPQIYITNPKKTEHQKRKMEEQTQLMEWRKEIREAKLTLLTNNDYNFKIKIHNRCQEILDVICKKFIFFGLYVERTEEAHL